MGKKKEKSKLAIARGQRVRGLRDALRYTREEFANKHRAKHDFTDSALQSWETARSHGLTENGARKLAASFQDEGLDVTVEWLMYGYGNDPFPLAIKIGTAKLLGKDGFSNAQEPAAVYTKAAPLTAEVAQVNVPEKDIIKQELRLFHQLNPGCVDAIVTDGSLAPWLAPGDHVAGPRYFDNEMERGINQPCIIQTLEGTTLIRILKPGNDIGYYDLICTNPDTAVSEPIIQNIQLFSVAPIIWIRKKSTKAR